MIPSSPAKGKCSLDWYIHQIQSFAVEAFGLIAARRPPSHDDLVEANPS